MHGDEVQPMEVLASSPCQRSPQRCRIRGRAWRTPLVRKVGQAVESTTLAKLMAPKAICSLSNCQEQKLTSRAEWRTDPFPRPEIQPALGLSRPRLRREQIPSNCERAGSEEMSARREHVGKSGVKQSLC